MSPDPSFSPFSTFASLLNRILLSRATKQRGVGGVEEEEVGENNLQRLLLSAVRLRVLEGEPAGALVELVVAARHGRVAGEEDAVEGEGGHDAGAGGAEEEAGGEGGRVAGVAVEGGRGVVEARYGDGGGGVGGGLLLGGGGVYGVAAKQATSAGFHILFFTFTFSGREGAVLTYLPV